MNIQEYEAKEFFRRYTIPVPRGIVADSSQSVEEAAKKLGIGRSRYFQILRAYREKGAIGLQNTKRGPKSNYRRSDVVVKQIIRHRFLDPDASAEVIAQKLQQCGYNLSIRSVERTIQEYGLQKKTLPAPARSSRAKN